MLTRGHKKYLKNPTWGLVPFAVFLICFFFLLDVKKSLAIGLISAIISYILLKYYGKSKISTIALSISTTALILTFFIYFIFNDNIKGQGAYIIICETFLVCLTMVIRSLETRIKLYYFGDKQFAQKPFFDDFFKTAKFLQYCFTLHLFLMLIYVFLDGDKDAYSITNGILFLLLPLVCIVAVTCFEIYKTKKLSSRLRKEEWLPIVNEKGEVTGKIAKSETIKLGNRFMHPVVRVALIYDGQLYLQPRTNNMQVDIGALDHPFEKYLQFGKEINIAARDGIAELIDEGKNKNSSFRFLIKHVFENEETKRLIFLYVLHIESDDQLKKYSNMNGKFWSKKQIEENISLLSDCLKLEYEYMKNTILMTEKIKQAQ